MGMMASQITSLIIVYSTVYSDADQRKHQSSGSLAFVRRIHRWPVNYPNKGPVTRKMFPFDDVIMKTVLLGRWYEGVENPNMIYNECCHVFLSYFIIPQTVTLCKLFSSSVSLIVVTCAVYPMKYAHGFVGVISLPPLRFTNHTYSSGFLYCHWLCQSRDCPDESEVMLKDTWIKLNGTIP